MLDQTINVVLTIIILATISNFKATSHILLKEIVLIHFEIVIPKERCKIYTIIKDIIKKMQKDGVKLDSIIVVNMVHAYTLRNYKTRRKV